MALVRESPKNKMSTRPGPAKHADAVSNRDEIRELKKELKRQNEINQLKGEIQRLKKEREIASMRAELKKMKRDHEKGVRYGARGIVAAEVNEDL